MLLTLLACTRPDPAPPAAPELGCDGFVIPERADTSACGDVDADDPTLLSECLVGSGHAGLWRVDDDGLPAYQLTVDHRCDPAGQHWSPRPRPQGNPVHALGNGRGLMAMARSSGAVELYSQDRGHQWSTREDDWIDPEDETWPVQLGGGFSWVVDGGVVRSTRFADLGTDVASRQQARLFGVGYHRTVTTLDDDLVVDRITFAPDHDARALVAEVTVRNLGWRPRTLGLVEVWDVDRHQVKVALLTSDLASDGLTDNIERQRRELQRNTVDTLSWSASRRTAVVHTETVERRLPDRLTPGEVDEFPDDLFLAVLSEDTPDAVWLADDELWPDGPERPIPQAAAGEGSAADRELTREGWGQHGFLAVRVPVTLAGGGSHTVRFAFGYAPGGADPAPSVDALRGEGAGLLARTAASWRDRLVWAAFPGLPDAAPLQRELAWSTYNLQAVTGYDELRGLRFVGQGGSYRYIHGLDGALGDFALFTEALTLVDPPLASETLRFSLAQQHAPSRDDAGRYPYATTGVGTYSDVGLYNQRSDVYEVLPWKIASYLAETRDPGLLDEVVPYWPSDLGEAGTVLDHLRRTEDYLEGELGFGSGGMIAMGSGDYADGVLNLTDEPTSPGGTSSTYNAAFAVHGFPLLADVLAPVDAELADRVRAVGEGQRQAYEDAWLGDIYARGFADNGEPMAPELLFVEPQVLAILAGLTDEERTEGLLALIEDRLETSIGAVSTAPLEEAGPVGGV
ncbi:MAG: hypothetical protein KC621_23115, partial [Myxococcales bacterium]|nr:hypothetical protein [Myxococcales bacterium]